MLNKEKHEKLDWLKIKAKHTSYAKTKNKKREKEK